MRIALIVNPTAAKGNAVKRISHVQAALNSVNISSDMMLTESKGHASRLAAEALKTHDAIAALGGDGTLNEIARSIKNTKIPLAVFPAGTGNDFIKSYAPDTTYQQMADAIKQGKVKQTDMGQVNGKDFINVLGIGFDAVVSAEQHQVKHLGGMASYAYALLKSLVLYKHFPVTMTINGENISGNALFLTIGLGPVCGGGFKLTPKAIPDDGLFDVSLLRDVPLIKLLYSLPKAFNGTIGEISNTSMYRSDFITIESPAPLPAHIDGDIADPYETSYKVKILPRALTVFAP